MGKRGKTEHELFSRVRNGLLNKYNIDFDVKYRTGRSCIERIRMDDCCIGVSSQMDIVEYFLTKIII